MQDVASFLAMLAIPGVMIVLALRRAWRSRDGSPSSDSGDGSWFGGEGGDSDGGGD